MGIFERHNGLHYVTHLEQAKQEQNCLVRSSDNEFLIVYLYMLQKVMHLAILLEIVTHRLPRREQVHLIFHTYSSFIYLLLLHRPDDISWSSYSDYDASEKKYAD